MTTTTDLFNLALDAAGGRYTISEPTEGREGEVCSRWYPFVRKAVLSSAWWPSVRAVARLSVSEERDVDEDWVAPDPEPGWRYAYAYPDNFLWPRHMADFSRFQLSQYNGAPAISAQTENAILHYTMDNENIDEWEPKLQFAMIYALAANITKPLTGKPALAMDNLQRAQEAILEARMQVANSDENQYETLPDWITARGYGGSTVGRYFYPYGPMVSVLEGVPIT